VLPTVDEKERALLEVGEELQQHPDHVWLIVDDEDPLRHVRFHVDALIVGAADAGSGVVSGRGLERLLFLGSNHASAAMAQRAKVLRRLIPIDLLEAQRDHHGLGKGEFKPRGQALRADVRGVLFQKLEHGLAILQECDLGCAYSVPGSEKTADERLFKRLGSQIASRTGRLSLAMWRGPRAFCRAAGAVHNSLV